MAATAGYFQRGDKANVGIGVNTSFGLKPSEALDRFVDELFKSGKIEKRF